MQLIESSLLNSVSDRAKESPRLRMNHNFHYSPEAPVQRLLNALEPGTVIPVHRHRHTDETYILLRGCIRAIFYDEEGTELESAVINPAQGCFGIQIPAWQWHSLEVISPGTVIFEVKEGPYVPLGPEDLL
ncbi:WbuC family cupin fold metalloprotein [Gaoshiqia sp. Z1-71]|uniref:WbuC family cupin fold metalloprotein n=1 Tax=Gaoshiqia hydrogeniformans TaxID=3290090 RepID=UPI003BF8CF9B